MPASAPLVLIVDDHQDSCEMYAEGLSVLGFHPLMEANGEDGFARACDVQPDVIVADVVLPGISGVELTRRLREDARTKDAVIIVLTARSFSSAEQQATDAGCDRFLLKPCLPDVLALEIRDGLTARRQGCAS